MAPEVPNFSGHHNDGPGLLPSTPQHLQPQNPNNNPNNRLTFNGDGQHRPKNERAMEKFRQVVIKIADISGASTTPTVAAAQKNLIEQRLSGFFSNFHTPNHPPYAAMIQKAIQELNEKGGSSEESISNYIKTEYKDLPWAHSTFLKNHLSKLCESGEISMTRKRCYLLGGAKPKRENVMRKRKSRSQLARGRSRGRKKEGTNEEDDEQNGKKYGEAIEGYKQFQKADDMRQNENEPDKEVVKLVEGQNLALELPNDVILDMVEQENSVMDLYPVPIQLQQPDLSVPGMAEELEHVLVEQISEIENPSLCEQEPGKTEELKQMLVDNPSESESTLNTVLTVPVNLDLLEKEQDEELPNSETVILGKPEEGNKFQADTEKPDLPINSELLTVESSIGLHTDARQIDKEQQSDISSKIDRQQRQLRRWRQSLPKVKPPATSMPSHSKDQHTLQAKQPSFERPQDLKQTPMENEVIQDEGKSQQQKRESGISVEPSRPHPVNLDVLEKEHDEELSNPVMTSEVEVTAVKESSPTLHQMMEDQQSKRQLQSQSRSHSLHKSATFSEQRQPELSSPEKSTELKLATINLLSQEQRQQPDTCGGQEAEVPEPTVEQLSHTDRGQRQLRRWTRSPPPKQAANSVQTELTKLERPKDVKENSGEQSTPITLQRAKLRSWQKQNKPQSNEVTCSLDSALGSDQLVLQTKPDLPERSAELEPIEESYDAPVGEPTRTDHQTSDVQDQPPRRGRGRPREPKPDTPVGELTVIDHQNPCVRGEPAQRGRGRGRGRGRPPKRKPDTLVGELVGTDHQNSCVQEEPARDSPVGEPTTGTDHQNPCEQEQQPRRGRGRPKRGQGKP